MSGRERLLDTVRAATAALEQSRQRIDDLNVYPVPDGDTGTNLALTARATLEALEAATDGDRAALAHTTTRATLMGARGNSGVILSQLVRGAAEVLAAPGPIDGAVAARALRAASDAGYRAVREPVEGTMLTVIREIANEAEARRDEPLADLLPELVRRGEEAVARTPEQLAVLRDAGVVDAGGAGLVELLRGIAAAVAGRPIPQQAVPAAPVTIDAIHLEPTRYRYCTVFVVEGDALDRAAFERELDPLGDSLLVVGDSTALKVHVHTDDPGAALRIGTARGVLEGVEIANMQLQAEARDSRILRAVPAAPELCVAVAVAVGDGNRLLCESLGAVVVDGGATMNPPASALVDAIAAANASEAVVLPNNPNVLLAARQAVELAPRPAEVVPSRSLQAGLAALVAFDPERSAAENAERMSAALASVVTGAVTTASRPVDVDGARVDAGSYLGLVEGEPVAGGPDFEPVAEAVVERLLAEPRDLLTLITGADEPHLGPLLDRIAARNPDVELDVHSGGQPHFQLLLAAE